MQHAGLRYLDFDIVVDRAPAGYEVRVLASPVGGARHAFDPLSEVEAERVNTFRAIVGGHRAGKRRIDSPEMHAAKDIGGRLFRRAFGGEVGECWRSSLDRVRALPNTGLRVRLRMGSAPELAELPWEYLYDATENQFISLSVYTPLVRFLEIRRPTQPLAVTPPLRVLVMISNPSDIDDLDVEEEWRQLREAVADIETRGLVTFDRLENATLEELQRQLRKHRYHVFHYIGHAGFDEVSDDGQLVLENERGRSQLVSAERLGNILHDEDSLRLAILNACEGARSSRRDPFSGLAQSLVQKGIPAVIAMQFEISDNAAITFSHEFYRALGEGFPADAALGEARKMISNGNDLEWGTPVLFLRAPDAALFDVQDVDEALSQELAEATRVREEEARRQQERDEQQRRAGEERIRTGEERLRREQAEARAREERILKGLEKAVGVKRRGRGKGVAMMVVLMAIVLAGVAQIADRVGTAYVPEPQTFVPPPSPQAVASPAAAPIAPPTSPPRVDPTAEHERAIRGAIQRAGEAEMTAFRVLDPTLLQASYGGDALMLLTSSMSGLVQNNIHQDARLLDRVYHSLDVDDSGMFATVEMTETWATEYHQNGTDLCIARIARNAIPQTLYLSRETGTWLIVSVDAPETGVEPTPCN